MKRCGYDRSWLFYVIDSLEDLLLEISRFPKYKVKGIVSPEMHSSVISIAEEYYGINTFHAIQRFKVHNKGLAQFSKIYIQSELNENE
jgi:hypothetical protein